jgi:hypothetical protein
MTETTSTASEVRNRFASLNLHDSRLLSVHVEHGGGTLTDSVRAELEIPGDADANDWTPATLVFSDCAFLTVRLDFWGKRACADAIAEATCGPVTSEDMDQMEQNPWREQRQPAIDLSVFSIHMCPPGGEIRVIARDFSLGR